MNNDCNHSKHQCDSCKCGISLMSIPAILGDDTGKFKPENGAYYNTFVKYEANGAQYFYSKEGIFSKVAEVPEQIQSDWEDFDPKSPAFIKNKPDVATINDLDQEIVMREAGDERLNDLINGLGDELNDETNARIRADQDLSDRIDAFVGMEYVVVDQLPATGEKGKIYLVPKDGSAPDIHEEYIWIGDKFELIGSTQMDLTDYVKNTDYSTETVAGVVRDANCFLTSNENGGAYAEEMSYTTYNEASDYNFIGKGTLENVIEGKGLVDKTYYATDARAGLIMANATSYGVQTVSSNGNLQAVTKTYDQYNTASNACFVGKGTLENIIAGKGLVSSQEATKLKVLTQAEYDALTPAADTIYFIKEA